MSSGQGLQHSVASHTPCTLLTAGSLQTATASVTHTTTSYASVLHTTTSYASVLHTTANPTKHRGRRHSSPDAVTTLPTVFLVATIGNTGTTTNTRVHTPAVLHIIATNGTTSNGATINAHNHPTTTTSTLQTTS
jgi:hypothetical protein